MEITELDAYKRLKEMFKKKGYTEGIKDDMTICCSDNIEMQDLATLSTGDYAGALKYSNIKFEDIPKKHLTREFFLHSLSGAYGDVVNYVRTHISQFDKQFFKDHIATDPYSLEFELNDFAYMPLEYIDEEMVSCAMLKTISSRYVDRRGDCEDWFYSVYERKPEVLTKDLYILGARCFWIKRFNENKFLSITPKEYLTSEYYFALCLGNDTKVMEDIPKEVLTNNFLVRLLNDKTENIQCFTEEALEKDAELEGEGTVKYWQAAVICDGYQIRNIKLNEERVKFFLDHYDKDSSEYEYGFKDHYKDYLREMNNIPKPTNDTDELVGRMTLAGVMTGMGANEAIDFGTAVMNASVDRNATLPIHYDYSVPKEYCKKYDKEEYLLEIYKKIGIKVESEVDNYYYNVTLPDNICVTKDDTGFCVMNANKETLLHFYDRGPMYDRKVLVNKIYITL